MPLRPEVRPWQSLCGDSEAIARFEPDLLLATFGAEAAEELGALRFLRNLWPSVRVVLVTDAAHEVATQPLAARLSARLLVHPDTPGQLAAAIEQARLGGDRPRPDAFVDLARGLADEVNNPLMHVSGHLQLLMAGLGAAADRDRRDQIDAALGGVQRIQESVERLRLIAEAANGPRRREPVDIAALLTEAAGNRGPARDPVATLAIENASHAVPGDREQLATAIAALVRFADDLTALGGQGRLELQSLPGAMRLRLSAGAAGLAAWQLPRSFEPHYPNRALRGQGYGLGLFLAQTVVLGHRGQATVRRLPDGSLEFDFVLPD